MDLKQQTLLFFVFVFQVLASSQAHTAENKQSYTLSTKMYINADGSVNLPNYSGYNLHYEDGSHRIEISGTFYVSNSSPLIPKSSEVVALRVWEKSSDDGALKLITLCCTPNVTAENVSLIQHDQTLQIIEFSNAEGHRQYREIRQLQQPFLMVTLGFDADHTNTRLRAIAMSAGQSINKDQFIAYICKTRKNADLQPPNLQHLRGTMADRLGLLKPIETGC